MHFVELAKLGQTLPPAVPPELLPPSFQSRQAANTFSPVPDGRERSDSGRERSGSDLRERSGSIDGRSRSGSTSGKGVCKPCQFVVNFLRFEVKYTLIIFNARFFKIQDTISNRRLQDLHGK